MAFDLNNAPLLVASPPAAVPLNTPLQNQEGMVKLQELKQKAIDEAEAQQAQQAFKTQLQQTGGDYDAALSALDKQGYNTIGLKGTIADYRKKLYENAKMRLDSLKTENEMMGGLMAGVHDQTSWDAAKPMVGRIDPQFLQVAGPQYDDARFKQYGTIGETAKEQHEYAQKTLENLSNGNYPKAIANSVAATNPGDDLEENRQMLSSWGVPQQMIDTAIPKGAKSTPELIQKARQATLTEKEVQDIEEKKRDDLRIESQNAVTNKRADEAQRIAQAHLDLAQKAATGEEITPEDIQYSSKTTMAGRQYLNMGDFPTMKDKHAVRLAAEKAGIPIVDAKTAQGLDALDRAKLNAHTMWEQIKDKLPKDASGRITVGPENKLSAYFQVDPVLGAQGTWRVAAIQQLQALAEPQMGLRITQPEVQLALDNDIPQITDTVGTAAQRIQNLMTMLDGKEQIALTPDRSQLLAPGGGKPQPRTLAPPKAGPTGLFMKDGKLVHADGTPY